MIYTTDECLDLAELHIDCAIEAWQEFSGLVRPIDESRKAAVIDELDARLVAASVLLRCRSDVEKLQHGDEAQILRLAASYNCTDDEPGIAGSDLH